MKNQISSLRNADFISVIGPDATKFLQGQLSCNMELLSPTRSLRGALCNLKGRVIADVRVVQTTDGCLLRTSRGMAEAVLQTLAKYAVFSKVKLAHVAEAQAFGVLGEEAGTSVAALFPRLPDTTDAVAAGANVWLLYLPGTEPRYELWAQNEAGAAAIRACAPQLLTDDTTAWQREDVRAGIVHVDKTTTEEYTPQLLNYDISGVIDFKKGCYTGQEIVARMFYRSVAKKRLCLLSSDRPVAPQDSVHRFAGETGKDYPIVAYSNSDAESAEPHLLLAVMDIDATQDSEQLRLTSAPDARLWSLPLHY